MEHLLKNEFRALQGFEHPNVVRFEELFEHDGQWFFTMELVRGVDFLQYVRTLSPDPVGWETPTGPADAAQARGAGSSPSLPPGPLHEGRLRATLAQLAAGLDALHRAAIVHRDVKPSNVLVTESGRVVIVDLGIADTARHERWSADELVGTYSYMAPEQVRGDVVDAAADWYAFGVVLVPGARRDHAVRGEHGRRPHREAAARAAPAERARAQGPQGSRGALRVAPPDGAREPPPRGGDPRASRAGRAGRARGVAAAERDVRRAGAGAREPRRAPPRVRAARAHVRPRHGGVGDRQERPREALRRRGREGRPVAGHVPRALLRERVDPVPGARPRRRPDPRAPRVRRSRDVAARRARAPPAGVPGAPRVPRRRGRRRGVARRRERARPPLRGARRAPPQRAARARSAARPHDRRSALGRRRHARRARGRDVAPAGRGDPRRVHGARDGDEALAGRALELPRGAGAPHGPRAARRRGRRPPGAGRRRRGDPRRGGGRGVGWPSALPPRARSRRGGAERRAPHARRGALAAHARPPAGGAGAPRAPRGGGEADARLGPRSRVARRARPTGSRRIASRACGGSGWSRRAA